MLQRRLYKQTQSKLFPNAYVRWRLELKETNKMNCFVPGCSFTAADEMKMRDHFYKCPYAVRVMYIGIVYMFLHVKKHCIYLC